ncbi:Averantin hydroxylase, partial [Cercospora beticola]
LLQRLTNIELQTCHRPSILRPSTGTAGQKHSDNLIYCLRARCGEGPVDLVKWFSLTAYDIITELTFGESNGCLDSPDEPWLTVMGARAKTIRWWQFSIYYGFDEIVSRLAPAALTGSRKEHMKMLAGKVQRRLKDTTDRKDFMSYILDNKMEPLSVSELIIMASAFIVAGSGTSARALAATIYFLCQNPEKLYLASDEVRKVFSSEDDITIRDTASLQYLTACIDEAMRMHPPNPSTLPRFVPEGGEVIEGQWVPGGIAVGVHQLSAGLAGWNFAKAKEYHPERWLDVSPGSQFERQDKASVQPFSYGPRSCVGINLAYAEMRLVLAKLLFTFNLESTTDAEGWTSRQKNYLTWEQIPLMIKLSLRT